MIEFSSPYRPELMRRGEVFRARSYPHAAFGELADPVLNVDHFEMSGPTFPPHPHAGFSAVTWLLPDSPGAFVNRDSLGGESMILPGEVHWSRASGGLVHEETPVEGRGPATGLQIFVNLRSEAQGAPPAAFHVAADAVPHREGPGVVTSTPVDGRQVGSTPDALPDPVRLSHTALADGASSALDLPDRWGGLVLALDGHVVLDDEQHLRASEAVAFRTRGPVRLTARASGGSARCVVIAGARLEQPVHERGPFKLASEQALRERIAAFERGEFGSIPTRAPAGLRTA